MKRYDVAVIGAGIMGACTALALRDLGLSVVLFDEEGPGHAQASSGGLTRIIRWEYGADAMYHRLVGESFAGWRSLEARLGTRMLRPCPALFLEPDDPSWDWEERSFRFLKSKGRPVRRLTLEGVRRAAPQFAPAGLRGGVYDKDAGMLFASHATRAIARALGEDLKVGHVRLGELARIARRRVVCAGPFVTELLPRMRPFVRRTRQVVCYYEGGPAFEAGRMPIFADLFHGFYGMPAAEHPAGGRVPFKVGCHVPGRTWDPRDPAGRRLTAEDRRRFAAYLSLRLPALAGRDPSGFEVCTYAMTASPVGDWILGRAPGMAGTYLACGFSGHGFKFGPAVGRHLAALVEADLNGKRVPAGTAAVMERFSPERAKPHPAREIA